MGTILLRVVIPCVIVKSYITEYSPERASDLAVSAALAAVALAISILIPLFFLRIPVPEMVVSVLGSVAGMNTPLAMIILGTYVARSDLRELLTSKSAYV